MTALSAAQRNYKKQTFGLENDNSKCQVVLFWSQELVTHCDFPADSQLEGNKTNYPYFGISVYCATLPADGSHQHGPTSSRIPPGHLSFTLAQDAQEVVESPSPFNKYGDVALRNVVGGHGKGELSLDWVILEVSSNLHDSVILSNRFLSLSICPFSLGSFWCCSSFPSAFLSTD